MGWAGCFHGPGAGAVGGRPLVSPEEGQATPRAGSGQEGPASCLAPSLLLRHLRLSGAQAACRERSHRLGLLGMNTSPVQSLTSVSHTEGLTGRVERAPCSKSSLACRCVASGELPNLSDSRSTPDNKDTNPRFKQWTSRVEETTRAGMWHWARRYVCPRNSALKLSS